MRLLVPACPPGASRSTSTVFQALGCPVNRGGEAGGSTADDQEVVELLFGAGLEPDLLCYLPVLGRLRIRAILVDHERQLRRPVVDVRQDLTCLLRALDVEPSV